MFLCLSSLLNIFLSFSDVMAIKTVVAQNLPIFVYRAHTGGAEPTDESALIWSCYYDNPDTMQVTKETKETTGAKMVNQ